MTDEQTPAERMDRIRREATNARRWEILSGILTTAKTLGTPEQISIQEPGTMGARWSVQLQFASGGHVRAWTQFHRGTLETSLSDAEGFSTTGAFNFLTAMATASTTPERATPRPVPAGPRDTSGADSNSGPGWPLGPAGYVFGGRVRDLTAEEKRNVDEIIAASKAADERAAARTMWTGTPPGHGPGGLPHGYVPGACGDQCNNGQCPAGRPHDVCVSSCLAESPGQGIPPAAADDDDEHPTTDAPGA